MWRPFCQDAAAQPPSGSAGRYIQWYYNTYHNIHIHIYVYIYIYIYTYIYIHVYVLHRLIGAVAAAPGAAAPPPAAVAEVLGRAPSGEWPDPPKYISMYIYIYIYREREREPWSVLLWRHGKWLHKNSFVSGRVWPCCVTVKWNYIIHYKIIMWYTALW